MGFESEIGRIADQGFSNQLLSELVQQIDVDNVLASGTSISPENIQKILRGYYLNSRSVEEMIRSGGLGWDDKRALQGGFVQAIENPGGSRSFARIVELVAEGGGYLGELQQDSQTPIPSLYSSIRFDPADASRCQVILFKPLSSGEIPTAQLGTWRSTTFRVVGPNLGLLGLGYLRI